MRKLENYIKLESLEKSRDHLVPHIFTENYYKILKQKLKGNVWKFYLYRVPSPDFYCWDEPVKSPVDGTVFRIGTGWPDHKYSNFWNMIRLWYNATYRFRPKMRDGRLDIRPNAGNFVMIQAPEGYIVFLAHLRNESIVVAEGQSVHRGQAVGRVGSSGNSTMPHLHAWRSVRH